MKLTKWLKAAIDRRQKRISDNVSEIQKKIDESSWREENQKEVREFYHRLSDVPGHQQTSNY